MKKVKLRILAALLSVIMILGCSNFIITAEDSPEITENEQQEQISENAEVPSELVTEDETLRDKFTKHYVAEDGKRYAVVYADQIHYEDNNGNWLEVDNSLTFDTSKQKYSTNNTESSVFEASFAPTLTQNGELVSVSDGEYTVSWSLSFLGTGNMQMTMNANASIVNPIEPESKTLSNMGDMGKAVSSIRYNSVYSDTDVRYSLSYGKVEEDIILNSKSGFTSYMMTIDTDGLTAVKNADGSIDLNNESGETVFNIASPWMKDSAGKYSGDIEVELIQRDDTAYIIYTPNAEWLDSPERVYPVLIDPSFTTRYYTSNYEDAYVSSDMYGGNQNAITNTNTLFVGYDPIDNYYGFIKILNIPELPTLSVVGDVTFNVYSTPQSTDPLDLYLVLDSWSLDSGDTDYLTYYSMPSTVLFSQVSSGISSGSTRTRFSFELSVNNVISAPDTTYNDLVEFFNSSDWHGFMLYSNSGDDVSLLNICSSEYAMSSYRPTLTIEYTCNSELFSLCDDAIYSFKNVASEKYLSVDPDNIENGANVFQDEKDNSSTAQAFRLSYDSTNTYCEIISIFTENSLFFQIANTEVYIPKNVTTYWQGTYPDCQQWIITPYDNNTKYKIISRADPSIALTSVGTATGAGSDTGTTRPGNVIASEFTGSNNQLWEVESGGSPIVLGVNIQTGSQSRNIQIGKDLSFNCPVYNFGDTVIWSVENTDVAYNYFGTVTAVDIGQTVLAAVVFDIDENIIATYSVDLRLVLNGDYFIRNGEYYKYLRLDDDASNYTTNGIACEVGRLTERTGQEWRITHIESGYYKISAVGAGNKVLSVPDSQTATAGASLIHENYTGATRQQWKIIHTSDGMYKFSPRSNESLYMSASESYTLDYDLSELDNTIFADWGFNTSELNEVKKGYSAQQNSNRPNDNRDEWIIAQILPMSGSEKDYDFSYWATDDIKDNVNCYGYALNNQIDPRHDIIWYKQQPGQYSGNYIGRSDCVDPPDNLLYYVKKDFEDISTAYLVDKSFFGLEQYETCPTGSYKVALVIELGRDYHWYRQDSNGFWSHKPGLTYMKNLDYSGNLIVDPKISNNGGYQNFIGYYSVTPWDFLYI